MSSYNYETPGILQMADSNLEIKLSAIKAKHKAISDVLANGKAIIPEVILGDDAGGAGAMMQILGVNAAVELSNSKSSKSRP